MSETFYFYLSKSAIEPSYGEDASHWHSTISSRHQLWKNQFRKPDTNHSFNQSTSPETTSFHILESGFLSPQDICNLLADTNKLIAHLDASIVA